ncbi:amidohydrolase family protein [Desulfovibrio litoralis]|uniref:5-methylthioadenosine/S-adenosylhomocysteine deaminase n=1 Tax=Desulfovibrio litoralis DSM 11393 TaxID=1121455 RepID=A0A1M7T8A9_9BACT|nr:amidohydrolase [Desulfovibrio litoralis]SHN66964.1 5-methylthioadenosine/S-adenosylhomocysteine deaminase [Desulfovibrio litoralis DSM 11393]
MKSKKLILSADYILTQSTCNELRQDNFILGKQADNVVLENCGVAINNGVIVELDRVDVLQNKYPDYIHSAFKNTLLMPALINGHTHASMNIFKGVADDLPLMEWLSKHIFPKEAKLTYKLVRAGALLGFAEMIRTGTNLACDMYLIEDAVCEAAAQLGIKLLAGEGIFAFPSPAYQTEEQAFSLLEAQIERWQGNPNIRFAVSPHSVYTTTESLLRRCQNFAEKHGLPLHIHLAESETETEQSLKLHKQRPVEYCNRLGLLNSNTILAHCVDLTLDEIDLLAENNVKIIHNPKSNLKLNSGIALVPEMLEREIVVGLGTDGAASNNTLNMFSEMNYAALIHKVNANDPTVMSAQTVLNMATINNAKALQWNNVGKIAPSYSADLIGIDLNNINLQPLYTPVSQLVYAANGHEVCFTMVNGEFLYKDGVYNNISLEDIKAEVKEIKAWIEKT